MATIAFAMSFLAALASCRWSRLCAAAFALAFAGSAAYIGLVHLAPAAHAPGAHEWLRWVSVVTGALGAVELVACVRLDRRAARIAAEGRPLLFSMRQRMAELPRRRIIASLLIASSLADGASWLWWHETGQWGPLPAVSCLLYAGVCAVGFWRRGRV